tara:strand:+ start:497 stop:913 length:417 start_codon:yes stop_codon:yes gene_type:complete
MHKRKYGSVTKRQPRKTHTDRFDDCSNWEEVIKCPLYDDWIKTVSFNPNIYNSLMEVQSHQEKAESRVRYESLCDLIDANLTEEEQVIFYGIAEQKKSLRVLAEERGCSYEKIRKIFIRCQTKLKGNADVQGIQSRDH